MAPSSRREVFVSGRGRAGPRSTIPPEMVYSDASRMMKEPYWPSSWSRAAALRQPVAGPMATR